MYADTSNYVNMPPVRDQISEGACAAFAITGCMNLLERKLGLVNTIEFVPVSPQLAYYSGRMLKDKSPNYDEGLSIGAYDTCPLGVSIGFPPEVYEPYIAEGSVKSGGRTVWTGFNVGSTTIVNNQGITPPTALASAEGRNFAFQSALNLRDKIATYGSLANAIAYYISQGYPVQVGVLWGSGCDSPVNGVVQSIGTSPGRHSVMITDIRTVNGKYEFLFQNSWGHAYGVLPPAGTPISELGYAWFSQDFINGSDPTLGANCVSAFAYSANSGVKYNFKVGPYATEALATTAGGNLCLFANPVPFHSVVKTAAGYYCKIGQFATQALSDAARTTVIAKGGYTVGATYKAPATINTVNAQYYPVTPAFLIQGAYMLCEASTTRISFLTGCDANGAKVTAVKIKDFNDVLKQTVTVPADGAVVDLLLDYTTWVGVKRVIYILTPVINGVDHPEFQVYVYGDAPN